MTFGCLPAKVDLRDYKMTVGAIQLPEEFECAEYASRIKNQKSVQSCVAHSISTILEHHSKNEYPLSTNFIYGIQNQEFGRTHEGMYLADACRIARKYGDMLERDCTGNTEVPNCYKTAEDALADTEKAGRAYNFRIKAYMSCRTDTHIKKALYTYGPVLASIKWYDTCYVDVNYNLKYINDSSYGLHAIVIYGWTKEGWLCQNSWGTAWGNHGRFILPFDYGIEEARGIVDVENEINLDEIVIPKNNKFLDVIYKIINWIINFINNKRRKK